MKILRNNIFETNSSSTHVLAIVKEEKGFEYPKQMRFDFGEFGWSYETYYDTKTKGDYLITLIFSLDDTDKQRCLDELGNILTTWGINYSFPEKPRIDSWGYEDRGYVDHSDSAYNFLFNLLENPNKLARFLFDDKSFITTGNDNDHGYLYPGIGTEYDYKEADGWTTKPEFFDKLNKLEEEVELYYKGN